MDKEQTQITTETLEAWELTRPIPDGSKLTPLRVRTVLAGIASGAPIETACRAAGISRACYYNWLDKAEDDPDSIYAEFAELAERARAASELAHVRIIDRAAKDGAWQAAAWLLERVYPHVYGQRNRTTLDGDLTVGVGAANLIAAMRDGANEADNK